MVQDLTHELKSETRLSLEKTLWQERTSCLSEIDKVLRCLGAGGGRDSAPCPKFCRPRFDVADFERREIL